MKSLLTLLTISLLSLSSFGKTVDGGVDPAKAAFEKWSKSFIAYPEASLIQNEEGMVLVSFEISFEGKIKNMQIDRSISPELDKKAIETVSSMPKEHLYNNGFIDGTRFVLPVKFVIR